MPEISATVGKLLAAAEAELADAHVASPGFDAAMLLGRLLGVDRGGLAVRRHDLVDPALATRFAAQILRRASREPLQYITGEQEFRGLRFEVDRRALVPRPETEGILEAVARIGVADGSAAVDLGTGTGCIAISLALEHPGLSVHALDASDEALALARRNARLHGMDSRIDFRPGDFAAPPGDWSGRMSLVVSNPPYVTEGDWEGLDPEVRDHEPRTALVAGPDGYAAYRALGPSAVGLLAPGGHLIVELGMGQESRVSETFTQAGLAIVGVDPDLRGIPRILTARKA